MQGFLMPVWFVNAGVQATALLALAALAAWLLRSATAAARRLLWLCALALLPALPLLSWVPAPAPRLLPALPSMALSAPRAPVALPAAPEAPARGAAPARPTVRGAAPARATARVAPTAAPVPWGALLWAGGACLCLVRWSLAWRRVQHMARTGRTITEGALFDALRDAAGAAGVRRPVRLLLAPDDTGAAMTWGWRHPAILLPARARTWRAETVRTVLLHEMAHIRHGDWPAQTLAAWVCALYWFHPLAWHAARRLRAESERAGDDAVLNAGVDAPAYAELLLAEARRMKRAAPVPAVAMARPSGLEARLRAILDASHDRRPLTRRAAVGLALVTALLLLPLAMLPSAGAVEAGTPPATSGTELLDRLTDTMRKRRAAERDRDYLRLVLGSYTEALAQKEKAARGKGRAADDARRGVTIWSNRKQWVLHRLAGAEALRIELAKKEQELRERIATTLDAGLASGGAEAAMTTDLEGPGVILTLRDAPKEVLRTKATSLDAHPPRDSVVHDVDIWRALNELRAAGARAVAINGERITERSAIVGEGAKIRVNGREVSLPLRIEAIGDPETIAAALRKPGGLLDAKTSTLAYMEMATLEQVPDLRLPAE